MANFSSSLPAAYTHEIAALEREVLKHQPNDVLQFCANHFQRRLESQRAEVLLAQQHSTSNSKGPAMAESNFPGTNPFQQSTPGPMQRLEEEEETDTFASPTASNFPSGAMNRDASPFASASNSAFGNFNFSSASSSASRAGAGPASSASTGTMDAPQTFPNNYNMNRRTSVSAESMNPSGADEGNWKPPTFPKTAEQETRLRTAISRNFLFAHLDDDQTAQVLGAMQERKIPARDVKVISQGDQGDYFYVVESGSFDIFVSPTGKIEPGSDGMGKQVSTTGPGTSFGELALMYNAPRAATVISTGPSIVWQLDRVTFRRILMDSAFERRRMYESFLDSVPLLNTLTPYERSKIADALETTKHPAGEPIIREGDVGDRFYILESGTAKAYKHGHSQPLKSYQKGDYFGELALLDDKPRAASVVADTEVKLATLGKNGFQRLLGPVESIMRRDDPSKGVDAARAETAAFSPTA
ncbi:hypothetical protein AAFC00_000797 [Neodothiora populina]|uniref:cAMP-dependent protein kinase regulatory subunit n=1 Tax=Neodothiora populina TaxID=2781224 RepID=A0ABR3PLT3_9PEZI